MQLILGALNGNYLLNLLNEARRPVEGTRRVEEVWAAVAYSCDSHDSQMLIADCMANAIPLKFWGRLDDQVAVDVGTLDLFLSQSSPDYVCKLVPKHHAKVIWWRGFGVYVGSANLTRAAWTRNVEAGCFFEESELSTDQIEDFERMFEVLDEHASMLTKELRDHMALRSKKLPERDRNNPDFWRHPSINGWGGLITRQPKPTADRRRDAFLSEWNETLQHLRDIAQRVSDQRYRPAWIDDDASPGAQADQFLHAHYYNRTFEGQTARFEHHYVQNKKRRDAALREAMEWWSALSAPPSKKYDEKTTVNVVAPMMIALFAEDRLLTVTREEFREKIVANVHAIMEYARRVDNEAVDLPGGRAYSIEEKQDALADFLWAQRNRKGESILQVLHHVLYGGPKDQLPNRLWEAVNDPSKRIERFGISAIGETVGWADPDRFPPRNGRTSKALRSLGYDVKVYVN